jgi:branched-chain amino acid transport system ATP-binding protein
MLFVDKITVHYGQIQALWDVSFAVEKGKVVALIGSNGAGKSTTINTITGILKATHGQVRLHHEEIQNLDPHVIVEKGVCQIPEERLLFSYMSVLENLELGAYVNRARNNREQTLKQVYELFPILAKRTGQLAGSLSGGEQQMLAIARGLMSNPNLLILDEPSFGLAPFMVEEIFNIIRNINQQGMTLLLVEQDIYESLELAHYGYVLENGRIILQGTSQELINNSYVKQAYLGI